MKHLTDDVLDRDLKSLIALERELLYEILLHIAEADRRMLYVSMGFNSLFAYLLNCGYCNASAQARIDTVRLSHELPEVLLKINSGALTLSQIRVLVKRLREKTNVTLAEKESLLQKIENTTSAETDLIVSESLGLSRELPTRITVQRDGSVQVEMTFSKNDWAEIQRCQELHGHTNPHGELGQTLMTTTRYFLSKKDPLRQKTTSRGEVDKRQRKPQPTTVYRRPLTPLTRRFVYQRDQNCQYIDPKTQKKCGTRFQLEIDHIIPVSEGGSDEVENLRLYCRTHNQYRLKYPRHDQPLN